MHIALRIVSYLMATLWWCPLICFGQQVKNVPEAFETLLPEPEVIIITNNIDVPTDGGHFQGVQVVDQDSKEKLLISGSSRTQAYILQVDPEVGITDRLIPLMNDPFRHAGGIQVSGDYLAVGIEDNYIRTTSKVCLYSCHNPGRPILTINREGEAEHYTAGATGILDMDTVYLVVVGNWNSRNWDFYSIDPDRGEQKMIDSFAVPMHWPAYQSINLIRDEQAIYAIGFYQKEQKGHADLVLITKLGPLNLIMEQVATKTFNCTNRVDFGAAAGLQVDSDGNLHIWATQRDGLEKIAVNRFSPR